MNVLIGLNLRKAVEITTWFQFTQGQWRNEGGKGGHLPPGAALWGRQIDVGMLRTNNEISNVSGC